MGRGFVSRMLNVAEVFRMIPWGVPDLEGRESLRGERRGSGHGLRDSAGTGLGYGAGYGAGFGHAGLGAGFAGAGLQEAKSSR